MYMLFPIITLVVCCICAMIYNGYFYDWDAGRIGTIPQSTSVIEAFSNCDAGSALAMGSFIALIITFIYYATTKALSFRECVNSIVDGFKSMVPAILILTFAWTLCAIMGAKGEGLDEEGAIILDGTLNAKAFIQAHVSADSMALGIIPFAFFAIACILSFATGTSWGTFGVLIPIGIAVIPYAANSGIFYLTLSAAMAGAVFGDHVSPISDTTIMASSGAQCNHIDHVKTQMPYAVIVAIISGITYIFAGFSAQALQTSNASYGGTAAITLGGGIAIMAIFLCVIFILNKTGKLDKISDKYDKLFSKKSKLENPNEPIENFPQQDVQA